MKEAQAEDIRLIICDIDGTLARDDKTVSEENIAWIRKAIDEKGIRFVLASGRTYSSVQPFYDLLQLSDPIICYNGAMIIDGDTTILEDHRIPPATAMRILKIQRKTGVGMVLYDGLDWFLEDRDEYIYPSKYAVYKNDCTVGNFDSLLRQFDTNKFLFMSKSDVDLDNVWQEIMASGIDAGQLAFCREDDYLEIMPGGFDKGTALDSLSRHLGITRKRILAIGDDIIDVSMFGKAGLSVAMENAASTVQEKAMFVTASNEADGVAEAIKKLVFGL